MVTAKEWPTRDWRIMSFFSEEDKATRAKAQADSQAKLLRKKAADLEKAKAFLPQVLEAMPVSFRNGDKFCSIELPSVYTVHNSHEIMEELSRLVTEETGYNCGFAAGEHTSDFYVNF